MKNGSFLLFTLLLILTSCGKGDGEEGARCRSAEEAQMKCQVDYAERYEVYQIPDHIKRECISYHPEPGCYLDSSKRYYW